MANPFSFSQGVFFKREMAPPINQEARIPDFVARPTTAKNYFMNMHSPLIFVHYTRIVYGGDTVNLKCMNTQARFTRNIIYYCACAVLEEIIGKGWSLSKVQ